MRAKVIFVDGPNAVGKDTFINNLTKTINKRSPQLEVVNLVAVDYLPKRQWREYQNAETDKEFADEIFEAHIELLKTIKGMLTKNKVILVNRSIISYLVYNVYPRLIACATDLDSDYKEVQDNSKIYSEALKELLVDAETLFIKMDVMLDVERTVSLLSGRMSERNEGVSIDLDWLRYIVKQFRECYAVIYKAFDECMTLRSDDHIRAYHWVSHKLG